LHNEPELSGPIRQVVHAGVVDGGHASQLQPRGHPDLAQEPLLVPVERVEDLHRLRRVRRGGHVGRRPEQLDRYWPVQPLVIAEVDLTHAAPAEQPVNPVPPGEAPFPVRHQPPPLNRPDRNTPDPPVSRSISARSRASASSRNGSVMIR
jgi:hypothetical protein